MAFDTRDYSRQQGGFGQGGGGGGGGGGMRLGGLGIPTPARGSMVYWLLMINLGVFFIDGLLGRMFGSMVVGADRPVAMLMTPLKALGHFSADLGLMHFQVWRLLTFQFLHEGFGHLLGNLLGLFFFGPMIESWMGRRRRFLAFYLLSGIVAALSYVGLWLAGVLISEPWVPLIGASGGVFAILAAATVVAPNARVLLFFVIPIPLKVLVWGLLFIAAYVVLAQGNLNNANAGGEAAHLGGALAGFVLIRNLGWLNFADRFSATALQANVHEGRARRKQQAATATEAEVDRILAKVSASGIHSLTKKEKSTLNQATESKR